MRRKVSEIHCLDSHLCVLVMSFHKEMSAMEKRYQCDCSPNMLTDYCWKLFIDVPHLKYKRKLSEAIPYWIKCAIYTFNSLSSCRWLTDFQIISSSAIRSMNFCAYVGCLLCRLVLFVDLIKISWPPLWSSGQSFWLQIHRSRVRFPALPDFLKSRGSGTGSTQPREDNWGATWMKK
jgi:hypothetical protein